MLNGIKILNDTIISKTKFAEGKNFKFVLNDTLTLNDTQILNDIFTFNFK